MASTGYPAGRSVNVTGVPHVFPTYFLGYTSVGSDADMGVSERMKARSKNRRLAPSLETFLKVTAADFRSSRNVGDRPYFPPDFFPWSDGSNGVLPTLR